MYPKSTLSNNACFLTRSKHSDEMIGDFKWRFLVTFLSWPNLLEINLAYERAAYYYSLCWVDLLIKELQESLGSILFFVVKNYWPKRAVGLSSTMDSEVALWTGFFNDLSTTWLWYELFMGIFAKVTKNSSSSLNSWAGSGTC
jgi:hypothetical protein